MPVYDGETLLLRPEGAPVDVSAVERFVSGLPGAFRRAENLPWVLVVPARDLDRVRDAPMVTTSSPGMANFVLVSVSPTEIEIYPGHVPETWARAQHIVGWLFASRPWHLRAGDRDLGLIDSTSGLYSRSYDDPDIARFDPAHPTESPPRAGELITFRRYLGNVEDNDYLHEFLRIHDSGAFSFWQHTQDDEWQWGGRVSPELGARLRALVAQLDFGHSSPGAEDGYDDPVALIIERPGEEHEKVLDATHPPPSFRELVHLMNGWSKELHEGRSPGGFVEVRRLMSSDGTR